MKIYNLFTLVTLAAGISNLVQAQELPDKAQEILKKLEQYEDREQKDLERDIVEKKKDVLKSLERSEKRIESEGMLKLYAKQIAELKKEIAASEAIISGKVQLEVDFIEYETAYHYEHPAAAIFKQRGELTFSRNNKAKIQYINDKGDVVSDQTWKWKFVDGKLTIMDGVHGDILVTQSFKNDNMRVILNWTRFNKTIRAKAKNR